MIDSLEGGGAERVLSHFLRNLDRNYFDVHLLVIIKEGIYLNEVPDDVKIKYIFKSKPTTEFKPLVFAYRLYRRCMLESFKIFPSLLSYRSEINEKYDIGISFCEGHNTPLLYLKKENFNKTISWIHIDITTHRAPITKEALYKSVQDVDRIYFVSEDARKGFFKCFPSFLKKSVSEVIYNPIETSKIIKESLSEKIVKRHFTLLAVGRLTVQKRFDKLINVHRELLNKGIEHDVWILGEGIDRQKLEHQIDKLGVGDSCHLLGFKNPYPYMKVADVFVMTSDYEGLPVVLCEAMVLGKPIVSTNVTGPRELLEDGKYGMLVENNEKAIEEGLEKMIENSELRESYIQNLKQASSFIFPTDVKTVEDKLYQL